MSMKDLLNIMDGIKPVITESAGVPMSKVPVKIINSGWGDSQGKMVEVDGVLTADANGAPILKFQAQGGTVFAQFKNGSWVADMD